MLFVVLSLILVTAVVVHYDNILRCLTTGLELVSVVLNVKHLRHKARTRGRGEVVYVVSLLVEQCRRYF